MQMKKKKTFFLLTAVLLLLGVMPMKSQSNLYFYLVDETRQSFPIEAIQKLTFTDTQLVGHPKVGNPIAVDFAFLKFFSLEDYGGYTGIAPAPQTATAVSVCSKDGIVTVKSLQTITGVILFDLQGRKIVQLHLQSQELNLSLVSYPAGVYLVQVVDENGITTKKIINN
jgi:hypothetical protein